MAVEILHERICRTWGSNFGPLACQANTLLIELLRPVLLDSMFQMGLIILEKEAIKRNYSIQMHNTKIKSDVEGFDECIQLTF